jgi:hypothetical protein
MWWSIDLGEAWAIFVCSTLFASPLFARASWINWPHRVGIWFLYVGLTYSYEMTQHYLFAIKTTS